MLYTPTLISIIEVLVVIVPVLLTVAFVTVAERKTMASMQRILGPNIVGYYGLLQAFADGIKLKLKEYVLRTQANIILFFLGPVITLIISLLGYAVVPYGPGLALWDFNLGILYMLAVSSLATYGILLAGWSPDSKHDFLGLILSTTQLISYVLYFDYFLEYISLFRILCTNISSYCIYILNSINKRFKDTLYIIPVLIFMFQCDINYSFLIISKYIYPQLPFCLHINIIVILILSIFVIIITNISNIFIIVSILFNTNFLLTNFWTKHINIFTKFKSINVYDLKSVIFTRLIAFPFVWLLMYLGDFLILNITMFNLLIVVYITQIPLSYINSISFELYKHISMLLNNISDVRKINFIKFIKDLDISTSNMTYKVNAYNLFIRIIMMYLFNIIPNFYIISIAFIFLYLIYYYTYSPPSPVRGTAIPLECAIPKSTATTLGLGTTIWSLINGADSENIDPSNNLTMLSSAPGKASFQIKAGGYTNIDNEVKNLICNSNILKLLGKTNGLNEDLYDEYIDKEYVGVNKYYKTVIGVKVINNQSTCIILHRFDSTSASYYPSYYINKHGTDELYEYLSEKYLINPTRTTHIVVFTQKMQISDNLYKVWRLSAYYDSFLTELNRNIPEHTSFIEPPITDTIVTIKPDNTHFDSFQVVNALNDCLSLENKLFFPTEGHYAGVFNEYLNYAKSYKHILASEYIIWGQKIDFLIKQRSDNITNPHTYVERKSPQEYMYNARSQNIKYICIDKVWKQPLNSVFGLNTLGLNIEFNEYILGNKGIVNIENRYEDIINKKIEIYSIISDQDQIKMNLSYSFKNGNRQLDGTCLFSLFKEYGSLNNKNDAAFINKCRLFQLKD